MLHSNWKPSLKMTTLGVWRLFPDVHYCQRRLLWKAVTIVSWKTAIYCNYRHILQTFRTEIVSHSNIGTQTTLEGTRITRGHCYTNTNWANGDWLYSSRKGVGNNMASYTHREMIGMHLIHGVANCNGRETVWMYREKYPNWKVPCHSLFAILHWWSWETC